MIQGPYFSDRSNSIHRKVSAVFFCIWLALVYRYVGPESLLRAFGSSLLPMGCIWFPEAMASYRRNNLDQPSHPWFIRYVGWFILFLIPTIQVILYLKFHK